MAYVFETMPADRALIDLDDPREVTWWSKRFGCHPDQLRHAVTATFSCESKRLAVGGGTVPA